MVPTLLLILYINIPNMIIYSTTNSFVFRQGMFSGLSQLKDEFSIKFLNAEGDFQALLSIQIPALLFSGNYETNITNYPFAVPTPDQEISGAGSYNSSFSLVEFVLLVDGRARLDETVNITNVNVSFDFTNPTSAFSNLALKSWTGWGNGDIITWFRTIPAFSDIPKFFSWNLDEFSFFLDFQSVANEVFRCSLQNAFEVRCIYIITNILCTSIP